MNQKKTNSREGSLFRLFLEGKAKMKIPFSKPYNFEGKEYKDLEIDFDAITGREVSQAKRDFFRAGNFASSNVLQADVDFCVYLAAKAAKLPIEFMEGLPAKDYLAVSTMTASFLLM